MIPIQRASSGRRNDKEKVVDANDIVMRELTAADGPPIEPRTAA